MRQVPTDGKQAPAQQNRICASIRHIPAVVRPLAPEGGHPTREGVPGPRYVAFGARRRASMAGVAAFADHLSRCHTYDVVVLPLPRCVSGGRSAPVSWPSVCCWARVGRTRGRVTRQGVAHLAEAGDDAPRPPEPQPCVRARAGVRLNLHADVATRFDAIRAVAPRHKRYVPPGRPSREPLAPRRDVGAQGRSLV